MEEKLLQTVSEKGEINALVVVAGLNRPTEDTTPVFLGRPMIWEPLELASCLEKVKRDNAHINSGFDWRVHVMEQNTEAADILRTQKVVTIIPPKHLKKGEEQEVRKYMEDFLPGAKRITRY